MLPTCLLLACACASAPARAFDLFGLKLFGDTGETKPASPDAQRYTLEVAVAGGDAELQKRIRAASLLALDAEDAPPPSTAAFVSRAKAEYGRILAALYAEGRFGGTITIAAAGRPVETLAADARLPNPVPVKIAVDPGPVYSFGRVSIEGRPTSIPPQVQADIPLPKTPEELGLVPGAPARAAAVTASEDALVAAWRRIGHPKARVARRDVLADHPNRRVDVALVVDPAPAAVYGATTVKGTRDVDPGFVARQTALPAGESYSSDEVKRAEKRLQRLEVFGSARVTDEAPLDRSSVPATQPMAVAVTERPLHVFGFGATYSTVDGAGVQGYWQHRNLFGEAERLRVDAKVSGIDGVDPRKFTYLGGVTFVKPGVIDPYTDLMARIEAAREVYDPYTEDRIRARIGLAHEFFPGAEGQIHLNAETARVDDAWGKRSFVLASVPMQATWDTTDNRLEPTRGFRLKAQGEPFYETEFRHFGAIGRLDGSTYVSADDAGRFVLAARASIGSIVGVPPDALPDDRLFFAGGGGSVRGYAFRSLGPRLANGAIVGGRSLVEGSLELRAKVTDQIGIVPFVDAGSAFLSSTPDFSQKLRVGAGVGLRYYTGIGAIRVDLAAPLNRDRGDPRFALYIGIGEAF